MKTLPSKHAIATPGRLLILACVSAAVLGSRLLVEAEQANAAALSPFGIGADNRTSQVPEKWIPQMAGIGIRFNRSVHTMWDALEPKQGEWKWTAVDRQFQVLADNKVETGVLLLGNPAWTTPGVKRGLILPVDNLPAWTNYVTELARHFKGRVKYWEVWNEPPNFMSPKQTAADYGKLVAATYDALKAVDPANQVGLAAKSVHVNFLRKAIQGGAKDHFDFVTVHPYEVLDGVATGRGTEPLFLHIVPTIRKMLADMNPEKVDAPILFTELGCDAGPVGKGYGKGPDVAAQALVKAYVLGIAQGVACINWFEGMDGDSGPMGLLDAKGVPRPSFTAMGQLIRHLGSHPKYLGWVLLNGKNYGFVFQGAKGTVLAAWAPAKEATDRITFGQPVEIVDPLTGQTARADASDITNAPMLALGAPDDLVSQAAANKTKPFPWGGDFSKADSVSLTMGEQVVEKGLHSRAGEAVASAIVAYGGNARAGDVPLGNFYIVDPNFLSYTPARVRITAVVRRNEANDEAGFNVKYESPNGFKTTSWFTIPDNKDWHTATWEIDDTQFVNMWGYSFALHSDGNKLNKYYVKSVTVEKLPGKAQ
jgi:hypothetical protein